MGQAKQAKAAALAASGVAMGQKALRVPKAEAWAAIPPCRTPARLIAASNTDRESFKEDYSIGLLAAGEAARMLDTMAAVDGVLGTRRRGAKVTKGASDASNGQEVKR